MARVGQAAAPQPIAPTAFRNSEASLSIPKGTCAKVGTAYDDVLLNVSDATPSVGIAIDSDAPAGSMLTVETGVGSRVLALLGTGGAARGDSLVSDSDGRMIVSTTSGKYSPVQSLEAGAAGEFVECIFRAAYRIP